MHGPFTDFALLLLLCAVAGAVFVRLRQPVLIAYIVIVLALGKAPMEALYVAVALTFSSTIIIVKLLSDERELDSLHGRIAVGFLIVQDVAVVIAMMTMSAMRGAGGATLALLDVLLSLGGRLAAAAVLMFVLMRWVLPAVVLSLFVLIGNPLIVMAIMGYMGYRKRTGFLAGLTVAQISEFSIVFVAMGITLGHVGVQALGLTTLVGLVTITLSTYMILYSQQLYERLAPWMGTFERRKPSREQAAASKVPVGSRRDVIVFGLGRYGGRLLERLRANGVQAIGVDFDPEAVSALQGQGLPAHFGDGKDPGFLESLPVRHAQWVITTLPSWSSNRALLHALEEAGFHGQVAAAPRDPIHGRELARAEVALVLNPFDDAADYAAAC